MVDRNIERFEKLCQGNHIDYRVHKDFYDFSLPEIKKESQYAALIILGSEKFYENISPDSPNFYLKGRLRDVVLPRISGSGEI